MNCPKCNSTQLVVADSRRQDNRIQRRRRCLDCDHRFNTLEITMDEYEKLLKAVDVLGAVRGIFDSIPDTK